MNSPDAMQYFNFCGNVASLARMN